MNQEDGKSSSFEIEDLKLSSKKEPINQYTIENQQEFIMIRSADENNLEVKPLTAGSIKFITDFYYYCRYLFDRYGVSVKPIDHDSINLSNIYDPLFKKSTNYKACFDKEIKYKEFNKDIINELATKILGLVNDIEVTEELVSIFKPFSDFFHRFLLIHDDSDNKKIIIHEVNVYFKCTLEDLCKESNLKIIHDYFKDYKYEIIVASDFHLYYPKLLFPFILRGDIANINLKFGDFKNQKYLESLRDNKDKNQIVYPDVTLKSEINKEIKIILMGDYLYTPKSWRGRGDDRDVYIINNSDLENRQISGVLLNLTGIDTNIDRNVVCLTGNHDEFLLKRDYKFNLYDYYKTKDGNLTLVFMHWFLIDKSTDAIRQLHNNIFKVKDDNLKNKTFVKLIYNESDKKDYYNLNILADHEFRRFMNFKYNSNRIYYILGHNGEKPAFEDPEYFINNCQYVDTPATSYYYWKKWQDHRFINRRINLHTKIIENISPISISPRNESNQNLVKIVIKFYKIYRSSQKQLMISNDYHLNNIYNPNYNSLPVNELWLEEYRSKRNNNRLQYKRINNSSSFSHPQINNPSRITFGQTQNKLNDIQIKPINSNFDKK